VSQQQQQSPKASQATGNHLHKKKAAAISEYGQAGKWNRSLCSWKKSPHQQ
jgi:hypothetical protein